MTSTADPRISHGQQPETTGDASKYPAQVRSITWHLLADGYTVTGHPPRRVHPHPQSARAARRARRPPRRRDAHTREDPGRA